MTTYIVCEETSHKQILEHLLPMEYLKAVVFVAADGLEDAISLARSLLVSRQSPLLLFADADVVSPEPIAARQHKLETLVGGFATTPFKVVLAVPEIEAIFFHDIALLERLTGKTPSPLLLNTAIGEPCKSLKQLMPQAQSKLSYANLLAQLSEGDRDILRTAPPIQDVIQFLQSVEAIANVA